IDCTTRELVYFDRFNKIEYLFQIERLRVACELFRPKIIKIDRLGNDAVCEFLATCKYPDTTTDKDAHFPVEEFVATNDSQSWTVQQLAIAFERRKIRIPNDRVLLSELEAFGITKLPSGRTRYEAPQGLHDDCVRSLCLAFDASIGFTGRESMTLTEQARHKLEEMRGAGGIVEETIVQGGPMADVTERYLIQSIEREMKARRNTHYLARKLGRGPFAEDYDE